MFKRVGKNQRRGVKGERTAESQGSGSALGGKNMQEDA